MVGGAEAGRGESRMMPSESARDAQRRRWFDFLAAESARPDGLLCFYDREKSFRVLDSCRVLARRLTRGGATSSPPGPGPTPEDEPCPFNEPAIPGGPD